MKKIWSLLLTVSVLLSVCLLSGCGDKAGTQTTTQAPETTSEQASVQDETTTQAQTTVPTQAEETTAFVGEVSHVMVGFGKDSFNLEGWENFAEPPYETFVADDGEYSEYIAFMQTEGGKIRDFKFYKLDDVDFVDGKLTFNAEEIYKRSTLSDIDPILIRMSFYGTLPSYAFSFVNEEGFKAFALNLSGMDGSITMEPIEM